MYPFMGEGAAQAIEDGAALAACLNRDGAWSGSEQSCHSNGNCRSSPVTVNPALAYPFAAVAAGRQTAPNSIL
jgi:hypothetical protein